MIISCSPSPDATRIIPTDSGHRRSQHRIPAAPLIDAPTHCASDERARPAPLQTKGWFSGCDQRRVVVAWPWSLREIIEEDSFKSATTERVNERVALKHEESRLQKTGLSDWIEPTNAFINTFEAACKIHVSKSLQEISERRRKIGTKRLISRKTVSFNPSPPFGFTSAFPAETRVSSHSAPQYKTPFGGKYYLVPGTGLEPARLTAHAPQTCVSTNSTTRAVGKRGRRTKVNPFRVVQP